MTADERLASARLKVERAKEHIRNVAIAIAGFLDTNPYVVGTKRNPQTRQLIYYVTSIKDVPLIVAAIAGDAFHNLRSALDHLAYQLLLVGTGKEHFAHQVNFPFARDADRYKAESPRKVKGMRPEAVKAINEVEPYKGGKGERLWVLDRLDNVDKHRLVITVGSRFRSFDVVPHMASLSPAIFKGVTPLPSMFIRPAETGFPLKAGYELFIDAPDAEVNQNLKFKFDVAFGEPGILEGESLIETLHQLANLVDGLLTSFRPLLT